MPFWEVEFRRYIDPEREEPIYPYSLANLCGERWTSFFDQWIQTVDTRTLGYDLPTSVEYVTYPRATFSGTDYRDLYSVGASLTSTTTELWTRTDEARTISLIGWQDMYQDIYMEEGQRYYTESSPCCWSCTIDVGDVQVYHWPNQRPEFSTLTNTAGITL